MSTKQGKGLSTPMASPLSVSSEPKDRFSFMQIFKDKTPNYKHPSSRLRRKIKTVTGQTKLLKTQQIYAPIMKPKHTKPRKSAALGAPAEFGSPLTAADNVLNNYVQEEGGAQLVDVVLDTNTNTASLTQSTVFSEAILSSEVESTIIHPTARADILRSQLISPLPCPIDLNTNTDNIVIVLDEDGNDITEYPTSCEVSEDQIIDQNLEHVDSSISDEVLLDSAEPLINALEKVQNWDNDCTDVKPQCTNSELYNPTF